MAESGKNGVSFERMSARELTALIQQAESARKAKRDEARLQLVDKWRTEAEENGLTMDEVLGSVREPDGRSPRKARRPQEGKVAAKFRGPSGEEWTGRGRTPKWLTALESTGRTRDEFRL